MEQPMLTPRVRRDHRGRTRLGRPHRHLRLASTFRTRRVRQSRTYAPPLKRATETRTDTDLRPGSASTRCIDAIRRTRARMPVLEHPRTYPAMPDRRYRWSRENEARLGRV